MSGHSFRPKLGHRWSRALAGSVHKLSVSLFLFLQSLVSPPYRLIPSPWPPSAHRSSILAIRPRARSLRSAPLSPATHQLELLRGWRLEKPAALFRFSLNCRNPFPLFTTLQPSRLGPLHQHLSPPLPQRPFPDPLTHPSSPHPPIIPPSKHSLRTSSVSSNRLSYPLHPSPMLSFHCTGR